jgi:protein-serine/threonine kinase
LTEALLLDHEKPNVSISSENLAKLTDGACLKNTPPLTPRAMSNEGQSTEHSSVTSAPQPTEESNPDDMDSSTDEITMKLDEAFPSQTASSPQNGPPVGPLKGKLFVKISEGRGLRPSFDPYVVCVFEWNEYISKGARDDEQEKKRRQIESDAEAGRPMAIPMKSRQSSHNSALDGPDHHKGKMPVTDPHWSHEAVLYVSPKSFPGTANIYFQRCYG